MNQLVKKDAIPFTLDELYVEARTFGVVDIFGHRDGHVTAVITFNCIPGAELKAKSGPDHTSPHSALMAAIENAKEIRKAFVS